MTFTKSEQIALSKIDIALGLLQESTSDSATLMLLRALLAVSKNEGCTVSELAQRMQIPLSSASRILLSLSEHIRNKDDGFGLIEARSDDRDLRIKRYFLSPKGRSTMSKVVGVIYT